jgi:hypothetical protein
VLARRGIIRDISASPRGLTPHKRGHRTFYSARGRAHKGAPRDRGTTRGARHRAPREGAPKGKGARGALHRGAHKGAPRNRGTTRGARRRAPREGAPKGKGARVALHGDQGFPAAT